jgi:predicted nucleotidyltransferase
MIETLDSLLPRLRREFAGLYGSRLKGLYVFGSYARGEADSESDLDILVVLDRVDSYHAEIERTSVLVSTLSLETGVSFSRVFVSEGEWRRGQTSFILNVREEAISA